MNEATIKYLKIKVTANVKRKPLTTLPDKYSSEGSMKYSSTSRITPLKRYINSLKKFYIIVEKTFDYVTDTTHDCKDIRITTKINLAIHFPEISMTFKYLRTY